MFIMHNCLAAGFAWECPKAPLYSFIVRILCRGEKITYRCDCRELLDEMNVELTSSWKEVKKLIKEDVRYSKFSSSDRVRSRHATVSAISRCHASFLLATLTGVYSFTYLLITESADYFFIIFGFLFSVGHFTFFGVCHWCIFVPFQKLLYFVAIGWKMT